VGGAAHGARSNAHPVVRFDWYFPMQHLCLSRNVR
jgi:hypothetical protein